MIHQSGPSHQAGSALTAPLFDDNPATVDLLGYNAIAKAIADTVTRAGLDPVTVGVNALWGGGKSTVLQLIATELRQDPTVMVVEVDPWEFADTGDARGTLITRVIDELQKRVAEAAGDSDDDGFQESVVRVSKKLNDLRKRIVWSKVASVAIKSAVTMTPDIGGLVEALTPQQPLEGVEPEHGSLGMAGFRQDFENLLAEIATVKRVVVLVDDLDRCLPPEILGSLEAIKLFLSVRRIAFVLAADEDLIRAGLASVLGTARSHEFAARYTEKIVQLPFTLPRLSQPLAQAYIALLLTGADPGCTPEILEAVAAAASERRSAANAPYVVSEGKGVFPKAAHMEQAEVIADGLQTDEWGSPRAIKRFLNNFAVRAQIARALGTDIQMDVLMKLWIMENRHSAAFTQMASLSEIERSEYLRKLETDEPGLDDVVPLFKWAKREPHLSGLRDDVTDYLTLASSVVTNLSVGGALTQAEAVVLDGLLSESDSIRRSAQQQFRGLTNVRHDAVLSALVDGVSSVRLKDAALESLQRLAPEFADQRERLIALLSEQRVLANLDEADVPSLADFPEVLQAIRGSDRLEPNLREAASDELEQLREAADGNL